ncbi:hypothetical protein GJ744_004615 [Endocarpon pusillum]|uniref:Uncharacterized protein n=1 Tax=Endocarpon pusillum TaxID=364733 RepID=A0A8H7AQP0_9EURO|nr:hypothetical protein GJ744_004615 [Endocarpon pusillum]
MLKKCLETLPRDLDATYARMLENIDEMYQEYATKILQWLCFANSPVALNELNDVLATSLGENPSFDPDARFRDARDVELVGSSLLSTSEEYIPDLNTFYRLQRRASVIRFAHFSVKEYLMSDRVGKSVSRYKIHEIPGQRMMAETCLIYHLQTRRENQAYPLAGYAIENWCKHWRSVTQIDEIVQMYKQAAKILGFIDRHQPDMMAESEGFRCGDPNEEDELFAVGTTYQDDVPSAGITYPERCQSLYMEEEKRPGLDVVASPLRLAIKENRPDRLQLVLSHPIILRVDRELFGAFAILPLELAVRCGNVAMAKGILEKIGTDSSECTDMIRTHRFLDPSRPKEKSIADEISLRLARLNVEISWRSFLLPNPEPLRAAARRGDGCFIIQYKISYGKRFEADRSRKDPLGFSAIGYARKQRHSSVLELFKDLDAPPSSTSVAYSYREAREEFLLVPHRGSLKKINEEKESSCVLYHCTKKPQVSPPNPRHRRDHSPASPYQNLEHPSLKQRSREPSRPRWHVQERVQSDSDEEESFALLPLPRFKTSKQFRERLRLNAICRMRFIATGYDLQHIDYLEYLEAEDVGLAKGDVGGVFGAGTNLHDCDVFIEFLTELKKLYTSYSISGRQVGPTRVKDELKPFWKHYISQMRILRDIQQVSEFELEHKDTSRLKILNEKLDDLKELRRQDVTRYRERIARSILNLDTSS